MKLIINADDFGMREDVTNAIVEAMAEGYVTQTTLMVNMPDVDRAVALARDNGFINRVGLHLNLTEGRPLTEAIKREPLFCDEQGVFSGFKYQSLMPFSERTSLAVYCEIEAQIKKFMSYDLPMMHIDGHNHVHHHWPVLYVLRSLLAKYEFQTVRRMWWQRRQKDFKPHFRSRFNNFWFGCQAKAAGVKMVDSFWNGVGFVNALPHFVTNQICEVMIHPRYNSRSELIDAQDFERNEGVSCSEVAQVIKTAGGIRTGTYIDFFK